jgi:hypothetical protein
MVDFAARVAPETPVASRLAALCSTMRLAGCSEIMPPYERDWVGPLLAFLKEQSAPVSPIDEQALDQILHHVGQQFVPADLNRAELRKAIATAIKTKEKLDRLRPGKNSRALRKSMEGIRQAAEALDGCLNNNNDARQLIEGVLPSISKDVIRITCAAQAIAEILHESEEDESAKYSPRVPTANEWLAGVELPLVFEEFFHRKEGRSRSGRKPAGPTVRFVYAVMSEIGIQFAEESIVRAMTRLADIRERRCTVRNTAKYPDIGQN